MFVDNSGDVLSVAGAFGSVLSGGICQESFAHCHLMSVCCRLTYAHLFHWLNISKKTALFSRSHFAVHDKSHICSAFISRD